MASGFPALEGKYEVLEKLHEGGMGAIYMVRHRLLDEVRVIKVMRPQHEADEGLRARFLREAQIAVKLRHPNIAQMYDFAFDETGRGFIVMEYVAGISLEELLIRIGPPPLGLSLELARQSLTALGFLHRKGMVHRDISPDNLMATRDDEGKPVIKLIDLGIAKVLTSGTGLTVSGTFLGKLRYASPEQFGAAGATVDQRSDIYSFGVVLYELFTGVHPVPGDSPQQMIAGHLVKPPLEFATSDPSGRVPDDLRAIVFKSMAKDAGERFPTAEALDHALAAVQQRFPLETEEFNRAFTAGSEPTMRIRIPAPGSTQDHINAQFGMATTPQPASALGADGTKKTSPRMTLQAQEAGPDTAPMQAPAGAAPADAAGAAPPSASAPSEDRLGYGTQPTLVVAGNKPAPAGPAPVPPPAVTAPPPKPAAPAPRKVKSPPRIPWPIVGGAAAVAVVAIAVFLIRGTFSSSPRKPAEQPTAVPIATPAAVATPEPVATAPAPETPGPQKTVVSLSDLSAAIASGSVERIRALIGGVSKEGRAELEGTAKGRQQLDLARHALEADVALGKAVRGKDWIAAVQQASTLASLLPADRAAQQARESAASTVEATADSLVHSGQYAPALAQLQALQGVWPERHGLTARLASVRSGQESDQRFADVLAAADAAEKERRPEKGLDALAQVTPDARWQERFGAMKSRLDALLAELDKAAPTIRLKAGLKLDYSRGKPFTVQLLVTDDYRVKSVTLMARTEGAPDYQALPVKSAGGDEYTAEVTPEFHANKTVEFFVVATDFAGHSSRLGGPDQPLKLKKRWLF